VQEDEVDEVSDSLKENVVQQLVKKSDSSSLKNNSNSTTSSSSSSSATITKRYLSKFKKEWLSDRKYSSFLKECKNDTTKALCIIYRTYDYIYFFSYNIYIISHRITWSLLTC
jgi:hypothetical protein